MEIVAWRRDGIAAVLTHGRCVVVELEFAERRVGGTVVEIGVAFERRACDQRSRVVIPRISTLRCGHPLPVHIVHEKREIGAALVEGPPDRQVGLEFAQGRSLGAAILHFAGDPVEIVAQHGVDHTAHRIGAVDRGSAIAQHLEAPYSADWNGVSIDRCHRHQVLGLITRMEDHTSAVEQHQRVAGAQRAEIDRGNVAARIVDAAGCALFVEADIARLRYRTEKFVAG